MTEQPTEQSGSLNIPKIISLAVLACTSGFMVWSYHFTDLPVFIATIVVGCIFGFLAGGLVGVRLVPTFGMMLFFSGFFEGTIRGWLYIGWLGAVLGAPIGIVLGLFLVWLPLMLVHLVLILSGVDPFVDHGMSGEKSGDSQ
jgi:hypothetical protein